MEVNLQTIVSTAVTLILTAWGSYQGWRARQRKSKAAPLIEQAPADMQYLLQQAAPKVSSPFFAAFVQMANMAVTQQEQIDELKRETMAEIGTLKSQLEEKETRIADLESRLAGVTEERDALQAEVDQLRAEVQQLRRQLGIEA